MIQQVNNKENSVYRGPLFSSFNNNIIPTSFEVVYFTKRPNRGPFRKYSIILGCNYIVPGSENVGAIFGIICSLNVNYKQYRKLIDNTYRIIRDDNQKILFANSENDYYKKLVEVLMLFPKLKLEIKGRKI